MVSLVRIYNDYKLNLDKLSVAKTRLVSDLFNMLNYDFDFEFRPETNVVKNVNLFLVDGVPYDKIRLANYLIDNYFYLVKKYYSCFRGNIVQYEEFKTEADRLLFILFNVLRTRIIFLKKSIDTLVDIKDNDLLVTPLGEVPVNVSCQDVVDFVNSYSHLFEIIDLIWEDLDGHLNK